MEALFFFTIGYFIYVMFLPAIIGKNIQLSIPFSLAPLLVLSGFRYDVGFDFRAYSDYFYQSLQNGDLYLDVTFRYMSIFFASIGGNSQLIFFTYAILTALMIGNIVSLVLKDIDKKFNYQVYVLLIISMYSFFYFLTLNQIRSSLSALFLCYAFMRTRRDLIFYICVVCSILFHSAAVFLIPVLLIINNVRLKVISLLFPVLAVLAYTSFFTGTIKWVLYLFDSRFVTYFNSEYFEPKVGLEKVYTLITSLVMVFILQVSVSVLDLKYQRWLKICFCFLILRLMSMDALIFARLSDFLKPLAIVIVALTIHALSIRFKPNVLILFYIICSLFLALYNVYLGSNISANDTYEYGLNFCLFGDICPV